VIRQPPALALRDVTRTWRGGRRALDRLTFHVPRGAICGFIGPNGAGKTTTFSIVSGFLPADEGSVDILGEGPFDPWTFKGRLGVLPQDAELPGRHTAPELLEHLAVLQGLDRRSARIEAARRLEQVRLGDRLGDRIDSLSHGMRRRVAVASALLGAPELVLLDEPTAGLDPLQAMSLREELAALRGRTTLVISSHNLAELERLCDWIVMIDEGRCVREGSCAEVTGRQARLILQTPASASAAEAIRAHQARQAHPASSALVGAALSVADDEVSIALAPGADADAASLAIMSALVGAGIPLRELRRGTSLEDEFMDASGRGGAPSGSG
jgi:ABC-type multidrug transport system ATPase subunit